jgi:hypothetical protein
VGVALAARMQALLDAQVPGVHFTCSTSRKQRAGAAAVTRPLIN